MAANATIERVVDHGMTRSVYFRDPDGIEMELFCNTFATEKEGLEYLKSACGGGVPMDIEAPEPPQPEIPPADFTRVPRSGQSKNGVRPRFGTMP